MGEATHPAMWLAEAHQIMADSLERRLAMHHTVTEQSARQVLWGIHCAYLDAVQHLTEVARKEAAHAG